RSEASLVISADPACPQVLAQRGVTVIPDQSLVARALRENRPVMVPEASLEGTPSRSMVCAPIAVEKRVEACLYVVHALATDLRGEDAERLVAGLATLAGAALEKAEAFARLGVLSRTLEHRVADRTRELDAANIELHAVARRLGEAQEQFVQAAKVAAIGTMVAELSHELNGPLSVILGNVGILLRQMSADDPARSAVAAIERQAGRCAELVSLFLGLSRKPGSERAEIALEQLLRNAVGLASIKTKRRKVSLEVKMPQQGACTLCVAKTQIESALLNLLDNAVDASPRGGIVHIEANPCERAARAGVEIRISDRGAGIEPDVLTRVFDPFFTTKPIGEGTGLGLPLARRFVEDHQGQLSIESRPGEGTTARLWLPTCGEAGGVNAHGAGGAQRAS
ncbi:MAG TPA: HAMP domain-containing sensor histidine kinase, partial [Anaeromyxobacteraceae bacterium]|nr:HAMP domain-containing sensor histidine kinase [Anaeromyxobacteraceae bacterium]